MSARRDAIPGPESLVDLDDLWDRQVAPCEMGREPVALEILVVTTEPYDQLAAVVREPEAARPRSFADELDGVAVEAESFDEESPRIGELNA